LQAQYSEVISLREEVAVLRGRLQSPTIKGASNLIQDRPIPTMYEGTWLTIAYDLWPKLSAAQRKQLKTSFDAELYSHKQRFVRISEKHPRYKNEVISADMESDMTMYLGRDDHPLWVKSQGFRSPITYRGLPMFKTAYDSAIYPMIIEEVRPQTIIEVGSGYGASALWLADQLHLQHIDGHVHSYDIRPPENISHPHATFHYADANNVSGSWPQHTLADLPHPWILICDHHENIYATVSHFF